MATRNVTISNGNKVSINKTEFGYEFRGYQIVKNCKGVWCCVESFDELEDNAPVYTRNKNLKSAIEMVICWTETEEEREARIAEEDKRHQDKIAKILEDHKKDMEKLSKMQAEIKAVKEAQVELEEVKEDDTFIVVQVTNEEEEAQVELETVKDPKTKKGKEKSDTYHIVNSFITIEETNKPQLLHIFKNNDIENVLCGAKLGIHWQEPTDIDYKRIDKTSISSLIGPLGGVGFCKRCAKSANKIISKTV